MRRISLMLRSKLLTRPIGGSAGWESSSHPHASFDGGALTRSRLGARLRVVDGT